ncbi:hypothetical protein F2Q68_00034329 [Brassica cretica]|uniref:Uncharacterized protein n=1 Tax=Brassica cretica TaxID=69181 RepID=A0A8S9H4K6_BRACR|nr:hypothetical protein F2Q68_00034329 [Brassica cretica]
MSGFGGRSASRMRSFTLVTSESSPASSFAASLVQTGEVVKRQEALARGIGDDAMKHHVNAIIDDDFWQVSKHEKLQEGDFEVESLMSFGGSYWCRSKSDFEHRSTDFNQNRSTSFPEHGLITPTESVASCNAVRITTHNEFAASHPHPPSPFHVNIDRKTDLAIDRQRVTTTDRQPPEPIDRRAPLTFRVQLPKIDIAQINALRPQPKPSANPPENTSTHSEDAS